MKRLLISAGFFWTVLMVFSTAADAALIATSSYSDAYAQCIDYSPTHGVAPENCQKIEPHPSWADHWMISRYMCVDAECTTIKGPEGGQNQYFWEDATYEPPSYQTCEEQGLLWDKVTETCVAQCLNGMLNGACLQGEPVGEPNLDEEGNECTPSSDDYQGVFEGKHYCDGDLPEPATCPEGQMAWIVTDDQGSGAFVCDGEVKKPDEAGDQTTETTTTETIGDETITTTTNSETGTVTTTITNNVTGESTTTTEYPGTDSETGEACTAESVACTPAEDKDKGLCKEGGSLCDDVNDIKELMEEKSDRTDKITSFGDGESESAIATAESELTTGINQIKAEISGYFDLTLNAGDIVCGPGVEVLGTTIQICPSEMKDQLIVIGQIVLLIAGLISMLIIFR